MPRRFLRFSYAETPDLKKLTEWLRARGANISLVQIKESKVGNSAGLGMFISETASHQHLKPCMGSHSKSRWWWPFSSAMQQPLASFPLSSAITAANILRDPQLGRGYSWMLQHGVVDERTIIMAYLIAEKLKGDASEVAPWINALPRRFGTPVMFSEAELEELKGTPLQKAAGIVRKRLEELWASLEPALNTLLREKGGVSREATFDDLLWAYSVFWSRGQSLPVPQSGAASQVLARDPYAMIEVQEGIVPGLDFCNHQVVAPKCWWELTAPDSNQDADTGSKNTDRSINMIPNPKNTDPKSVHPVPDKASPSTSSQTVGVAPGGSDVLIHLCLHRGTKVSTGEELMISYGDKSNEELLMLYGFAVPGNPHDRIMMHCPVPPFAEWDEAMQGRIELMKMLRYELQFFLPHPGNAPEASENSTLEALESVLRTLEVFVLTKEEVTQKLHALKTSRTEALSKRFNLDEFQRRWVNLDTTSLLVMSKEMGIRMGAAAALVKMLETRVQDLEGAGGTGTFEQDLHLLSKMSLDSTKFACVAYRCGQKCITREYLKLARQHLQDVLTLMQDVEDKLKHKSTTTQPSVRG
ncbi:hypothetical protein CEUSTIGMA_g2980.t1 [Chlamydomonas eustigma]|uniref:SET domain-containing protein n=1 Tax=Chlamydomonas eustigma TaxID=1157962 RepID=A0A250WXH9_9CHLO|nr:hypothetical protein CEUSTIGMA_g2980.t1 [Chlamydomonas eustigma]|eukprot:GAX75537.1 hypothetical protein CEUSTIGMA_g2980.t1 [Chlamydomonas eustigma]